jgi:hypothetical protein
MPPEVIPGTRLDSDQTVFFARELEHVKSETYDVRYADLKARLLFPVATDAGPAAESITYYQYDQVGFARIVGSYAKDLPRADVRGKKFTSTIESLADAYGYTLQDVRSSAFTGKRLETRKADAAKRAIEQKINDIAFQGDAEYNIPGFLTNPNIPLATVATAAGGGTAFTGKTPDEILHDLHDVVHDIVILTKGKEIPTTLLLPLAQFTLIASKRIGDGSSRTILEQFLATSPFIKEVDWVNELAGAGTNGADMMAAYKRDPKALTLEIPQDFEQLPVQEVGLEYEVPCHARIGGVIVYYPLSIGFAEGI